MPRAMACTRATECRGDKVQRGYGVSKCGSPLPSLPRCGARGRRGGGGGRGAKTKGLWVVTTGGARTALPWLVRSVRRWATAGRMHAATAHGTAAAAAAVGDPHGHVHDGVRPGGVGCGSVARVAKRGRRRACGRGAARWVGPIRRARRLSAERGARRRGRAVAVMVSLM